MENVLSVHEVAEIRGKLKDHGQKLNQLYPIVEELVDRLSKLETALADQAPSKTS